VSTDNPVTPDAAELLSASAQMVAAAADQALLLLTGEMTTQPQPDTPPLLTLTNEMMVRPAASALPAGLARSLISPVVQPATAPRPRLARGFVLALGLHVLVLGCVVAVIFWHKQHPPPRDVVIAMAMESAPATGAVAQAPKPVQKAPPPAPMAAKPAPISPAAPPAPVVEKPAIIPVATRPAPRPPSPKPLPPTLASAPDAPPGPPHLPHPAPAIDVATTPAHPDDNSTNPPPDYPQLSRDRGEEGEVVLSIHVLADGLPSSVSIATSSGYPMLDDAARDAVLRWHFAPALRSGGPVDWDLSYRILFQLQ
jgi:protein TonB